MWFDSLLYLVTKSLMNEFCYLLWCLVLDCIFSCFQGSSWCQEIKQQSSTHQCSRKQFNFKLNLQCQHKTFKDGLSRWHIPCILFFEKIYLLSLLSFSSPSALLSLPPCQLYCPYGSTLLTPLQTSKSAKTLVQSADFTTSLWWQGLGFVRVLERVLSNFCSYWVTANILHVVCCCYCTNQNYHSSCWQWAVPLSASYGMTLVAIILVAAAGATGIV